MKNIFFPFALLLVVQVCFGQAPTCPSSSTVMLYQGGPSFTKDGWLGAESSRVGPSGQASAGSNAVASVGCPQTYTKGFDGFTTSVTHNPTSVGTFSYGYAYQVTGANNLPDCDNITSTVVGCSSSLTIKVQTVTVTATGSACVSTPAYSLSSVITSSMTGLSYTASGPGVSANIFNPATAGVGVHAITIVVNGFANGSVSRTHTITVTDVVPDISGFATAMCKDAANTINLSGVVLKTSGGASAPGSAISSITIDGSGVSLPASFNPASYAPGDHTIVYNVTSTACVTPVQTSYTVKVGENFSITPNSDYSLCEGGPLNLTTTTPPSVPGGVTGTGTWSMVTTCAGCLSGTTYTPPDITAGATQAFTINYAYSGSGSYLGCNKNVNKTITVKPKSDLTFANTSVQECANGIIYLTSKFVPRANGSNVTPASYTFGSPSLSSYYTAGDQSINAGSVVISGSQQTFPLSFSYTNSFSCTSTSTNANLILDKIPNAPANTNTAAQLKACGSGSFTLTANGAIAGESYVWRNEAGIVVGGSGNSYSTGPLGVGTYIYSVAIRGVNACESQRTNITINVYANPSIGSTVASLTKCTGTYTVNLFTDYGISTSGSGTNNWTTSNSTVSAKLNASTGVLTMTGLTATTNIPITYKFTSTEGCQSTLSLTLNINAGVATPVVADVKNCEVGAANLSVTNVDASATYNWYDASSGGNLLGTGAGYTTSALTAPQNSSQTYSYFVSASSSSCTSVREEVVVTVVNTDQIVAGVDLSFCDNTGKVADLRGAASPAGGTFSGTGVTYVGVTPVFNCGSDCGVSLLANNENYTITYSYTNTGCTYTDVRVISLGFKPTITVTPALSASAQEVQVGEYVNLEHNYDDATETTWTFVGEGTGAIGNPVGHIYYTEGYKSIDVTIKRAGCTGQFTVSNVILVEPDPFDIITGTEDPLDALKRSDVYPNPMNGALAIESKTEMYGVFFTLLTYQGNGVVSRQMNLNQGRNEIFETSIVNALPVGIYLLKVGQGRQSYTLKLVKR